MGLKMSSRRQQQTEKANRNSIKNMQPLPDTEMPLRHVLVGNGMLLESWEP